MIKRVLCILTASVLILLLCCYSNGKSKAPLPDYPSDTESFTDGETVTESTENTAVTETSVEDTTETASPDTETTVITEPPDTSPPETVPPVTVPPVTEPAPEPEPVDYSNLPLMYGYYPDIIPDRTWQAVKAPSPNSQSVDPSKPMLALTFDDGPSVHTERLLNIFMTYGGKGTFFVVGNKIAGREAILKRMADEGHEIGGHGWNHANLSQLGEQGIVDQIMMTRAKIYSATGYDCHIIRPPYGARSDMLGWTAAKLGVGLVLWSVDTLDWKTRNADAVYNAVTANARDGAIILCHDLHGTTVDAMERVIPALINAGYQLVTVSEMMSCSANPFQAGNVYNRK